LVRLLHAGAEGAPAAQNDDVARFDAARSLRLDGGDGGALAREHARTAEQAIDAAGIERGRIDGRALHDRAAGRQVAAHEGDGRAYPRLRCALRREDDLVGVHAVLLAQSFAQSLAALALLPRLEHVSQRRAVSRERVELEQTEPAQMQHDLWHA